MSRGEWHLWHLAFEAQTAPNQTASYRTLCELLGGQRSLENGQKAVVCMYRTFAALLHWSILIEALCNERLRAVGSV